MREASGIHYKIFCCQQINLTQKPKILWIIKLILLHLTWERARAFYERSSNMNEHFEWRRKLSILNVCALRAAFFHAEGIINSTLPHLLLFLWIPKWATGMHRCKHELVHECIHAWLVYVPARQPANQPASLLCSSALALCTLNSWATKVLFEVINTLQLFQFAGAM